MKKLLLSTWYLSLISILIFLSALLLPSKSFAQPTWQVQSDYFGTVNTQSQIRSMRGIALTKDNPNISFYVGYIQGSSTSAVRKVKSAVHSTFGADAIIIGNYIAGPPTNPTYTGTYTGTNPAYTGGSTGVLEANLTNSSRTFRNLATDDRGYVYTPNGAAASNPEVRIYDAGLNPGTLGSFSMAATGNGRGIKVLKVGSNYYCYVAASGGKIERWDVTNVSSPTLDVSWGITTGGTAANGRIDLATLAAFIGNLGLTLDVDGTLYVVNGATNNAASGVFKISNNGDLRTAITANVPFAYDVAVFRSKLYVVKYNTSTSSIAVLNKSDLSNAGTLNTGIPHTFIGDSDNGYSGIDVSNDGRLFVVDQIYENRPGTTPYTPPVTSFNPAPTIMAAANIIFDRVLVSSPLVPTVITTAATAVTNSSATLNGTVNANGSSTDVTFDYGPDNTYGTSVAGTPSPVTGSSTTPVSANIATTPNKQYHYRVTGVSSGGTSNGNDITFTTLANVPGAPTVGNPTFTTLDVTVNPNGNPANTEFAIHESTTNKYVQADGSLGAAPVWQTASAWGTKTVTGLAHSTLYTFEVKARNSDNIETAFGPSANGTTNIQTAFYVDDNSNSGDVYTPGATGNDANPGTATAPFRTINHAIALAAPGNTIFVDAGTYDEDVTVSKSVKITGAGVAITTIRGPIGGSGSTVAVAANNVEISGFTITRSGNNTTDWNNPDLNIPGVSVQGQAITGMLIHDNIITGNRTGIDINNSNGHTIRNNVITNNRTGLIFRNQTDNITFQENEVTNNWTVGILFIDGSGLTNSPVQTAANCSFFNNNISGNWYSQIVDRQNGGSLPAPGTNLKNFSGNWYGTNTPVVTTANSTEPGYAAQIPVEFGGTATPPGGQPDIAGPASANFDYTPFLNAGTDVNVETTPGRGTFGFQGSFANLWVAAASAQTGATERIQEGVNLVSSGGVINLTSGTFTNVNVSVNKSLTLNGKNAGTSGLSGSRVTESFIDNSSNLGNTAFTIDPSKTVSFDGIQFAGRRFISFQAGDVISVINSVCNWLSDNTGQQHIDANGSIFTSLTFQKNNVTVNGPTQQAFQLFGTSLTGSNNTILIKGNRFYGGTPVAGDGSRPVILNLDYIQGEISENDFDQVDLGVLVATGCGNLTIKQNDFHGLVRSAADHTANSYAAGVVFFTPAQYTGPINIQNNFFRLSDVGVRTCCGSPDLSGQPVNINNNSFTDITYYFIRHLGTGTINATCNWYGSTDPAVVAAKIVGPVTYSPFLTNGTDDAPATPGFQPVAGSCGGNAEFYVDDDSNTGDVYTPGATGNDANAGTAAAPFRTIAHAIAVASPGDIIKVDAGTYSGSNGPDKKLTFLGANPTISPNTGSRNAESILTDPQAFRTSTTSRVIIKGFKFTTTGGNPIDNYTTGAKVTLEKNLFDGSIGLFFASPDSLEVIDNRFKDLAAASPEGIQVAGNYNGTAGTYMDVHDNTWINGLTTGMNLSNVRGIIYHNNFTGIPYYGVLVANRDSLGIYENTFSGITNPGGSPTYGAGVRFFTPSPGLITNVTNNYFTNNAIGVAVRNVSGDGSLAGTTVHINNNSITGSTDAHIKNQAAETLEATCNWYGSSDPAVITPKISGPVTYVPFLTNGTDNSPGTPGFQPVPGSCNGSLICESPPHQAYSANTTAGNQAWRGELGMQFIVNNPGGILIKQLGAFDDGGNGITGLQSGGVRVAIFNRSTQTIVPGLNIVITGLADHYTGNHRMVDLASPVTLPPGDYYIVAKGYHNGEKNGTGDFPPGDNGGGAITFGNVVAYGIDDPNGFSYPPIAYGGSTHAWNAGTFIFTTTGPCGGGPSNNANLSNLVLSQGTLAPPFAQNTTSYTASVPNSTTSITVTPTAADPGATITVNGTPVASGNPSAPIALAVGSNPPIDVQVTAADGTTIKHYFVTVTRNAAGPSNNANLSNLVLSQGTLTPPFAQATTSYTATVPNSTSSITVTPTAADPGATITVNGTPVASGSPSAPIALAVGSNPPIDVQVTAADGTTIKHYFVTVTRNAAGPSNNANLSNLTLSDGTLSPPFAQGTTNYTATVPNSTSSITVTPTAADPGATITVNGTPVASGSPSAPIALAVGSNPPIDVQVTAADGTTIKHYFVTVTRSAPGAGCESSPVQAYTTNLTDGNEPWQGELGMQFIVNNASGIIIKQLGAFDDGANGITGLQSGGVRVAIFNRSTMTIVPGLNVVITGLADHYTGNHRMIDLASPVTLPPGNYVIVAKGYHAGEKTRSGSFTPGNTGGGAITFGNEVSYGPNNPAGFNYPVTAYGGDAHAWLAGTFVFTTAVPCGGPSNNANLSNLVLNQGTLTPPFAQNTTNYTATVPNSTSSITVTPTAADPGATITVNGTPVASGNPSAPIALAVGSNPPIDVQVTAADGTTIKHYFVTVTRNAAGPSNNANLSNLVLSQGTLTPPFAQATTSYTATVPNSTSSITVTPTAADPGATITVNGTPVASGSPSAPIALAVGSNPPIDVQVTAADGTTIKHYFVTVTRSAPGGSCESSPVQAYTTNLTDGNEPWQGELGMQFIVNNASGIIIKQLGAFDDGANGITGLQSGGVRVAIFNRSTMTIVPGLNIVITGLGDHYTGNHRMVDLASPVTLPPGNYVIVAKGYHAGERTRSGSFTPGNDGGGAITFGNEVSYGPNNPAGFNYPITAYGGDAHAWLAGTFVFTVPVACATLTKAGPATGEAEFETTEPTDLKVYPNPTNGQFNLQLIDFGVKKVAVQILDQNGRIVEQKTISVTGKAPLMSIPFNLRNRAAGMYFIRITDSNGVRTGKVVIQR